ncbi:MAG: STAS domain-containing protein [Acidobacteriaceae bacterium]
MPLDIDTYKTGDLAFVRLKGSLTAGVSLSIAEGRVQQAISDGAKKLLLDIGQISYADSSGLGMLMQSFAAAQRGECALRIVGANQKLRDLLQTMRLDTILTLDPDVDTALKKFFTAAATDKTSNPD